MTTTTLTFSMSNDLYYTPFKVEVDSTDADRVKRLLDCALNDYMVATSGRKMRLNERILADAKQARNAERARLRGALKRLGIEVKSQDDSYRSGKADLQRVDSYSKETTNGWLRLSAGNLSSYSLLAMVAKLGKQTEIEWELRRESRKVDVSLPTEFSDVLYVRMPERIES